MYFLALIEDIKIEDTVVPSRAEVKRLSLRLYNNLKAQEIKYGINLRVAKNLHCH